MESSQMRKYSIEEIIAQTNKIRNERGFLSIDEVYELTEKGNILLDPFSLLIGRDITIGEQNILYPNTILETQNGGSIEIGSGNTFYPNTLFIADHGKIEIGDKNQFGDGGCSIKANMPGALITIGSEGRYLDGPTIVGKTTLGSGSQVIGRITVQNCMLGGGTSFLGDDPDLRGAVLKGMGLARNITVEKGHVINGNGDFSESPIETQASYHPKRG